MGNTGDLCDKFNLFCSCALCNTKETFMLISTLEAFFAYGFACNLKLEEEEFLFAYVF